MFHPEMLTDREFTRWLDLRQSLATGTGIKRSARDPINIARLPVYGEPRRVVIERAVVPRDDDDVDGFSSHIEARVRTGEVKRTWDFPAHDILFGFDVADYRRVQRSRLSLEGLVLRRFWKGWRPATIDQIADRFRKFDPLPAFEQVSALNAFGRRYISR